MKQKITLTPNFPRIGFSYLCARHLCACSLLALGCGAAGPPHRSLTYHIMRLHLTPIKCRKKNRPSPVPSNPLTSCALNQLCRGSLISQLRGKLVRRFHERSPDLWNPLFRHPECWPGNTHRGSQLSGMRPHRGTDAPQAFLFLFVVDGVPPRPHCP